MGLLHTSASAWGTSKNIFPQHHKASSAGLMTVLFPSGRTEYSFIVPALHFSKSSPNFPLIFLNEIVSEVVLKVSNVTFSEK